MNAPRRFLALGDSFTEGVGDLDPARPNGVRGWADRVAEVLGTEGWEYANLAIRGKKLPQVLAEQIEPALALQPDVVTLYAGANDLLRPRVDLSTLSRGYLDAVRRLTDSGAEVLLFTGFDLSVSPVFSRVVGRVALYNERVREIADVTGARVADYWRWREFGQPGYWAEDRMHMNERGHALMARRILDLLGRPQPGADPEPLPEPVLSRRDRLAENSRWAVQYAGPWVQRRLKGTSSGDTLQARYPHWVRLGEDGLPA